MQYEGLHKLCFECGRYGHKEFSCKALKESDLIVDKGLVGKEKPYVRSET